jgi:cytochrome P450
MGKNLPHQTLAKLAQKHGPIMSLRFGAQLVIVGSSPAVASQILKTHDRVLSGRHLTYPVRVSSSKLHNLGLGFSDKCDDNWNGFRTIYRGEIFSVKALNSQVGLREEKVMEMLQWLISKQGQVVKIKEIVFATALNILSNTFFSVNFLDYEGKGFGEDMRNKIRRFGVLGTSNTLYDIFPIFYGWDFQRLCTKLVDVVDTIFDSWSQIIKQRREGKRVIGDFADVLLQNGYKDHQINPMILELFSAGTESTSATSEWAVLELLRNPRVMQKLRDEISKTTQGGRLKESDLPNLPYLDACVKETLRMHPPGPLLLPHRATKTCQVMGYTIPKNSHLMVNMWSIGRDPTIWDDPLSFKPERFIQSGLDFKGQDFEYIPFGSGRRMCPGQPLAARVVPLIVGSIVNTIDYALPDNAEPSQIDMSEMYDITLQKKEVLCIVPKVRAGVNLNK